MSEEGSSEGAGNLSQPGSSEVSQEEIETLLTSFGQDGGDVFGVGNAKDAPGSNARIQVSGPAMSNMLSRFGLRLVLGTEATEVVETLRTTGHVFTTVKQVTSQAERIKAADEKEAPKKRMEDLVMSRLRRLTRRLPSRSKVILVTTAQLIKNAGGVEKSPDDPIDLEWLNSLSGSSVKTVTALALANVGTGHTVFGVHETTVYFRRIPESIANAALHQSLPLVPLDNQALHKYIDRIDGAADSVGGLPIALFNTLMTDVMRISASEMIARENALTLGDILPSGGCIRGLAVLLVGAYTALLLYLLWHFNVENGTALGPTALLTRDGFSAVAFHGASVVIEDALRPSKQSLLSQVRGRVVEVGAGAGANLALYATGAVEELFLVEPSPVLQEALANRAADAGIGAAKVSVVGKPIEAVTMTNRSVDYVVTTLSLNCVSSTQRVLEHVYTWLKPGGKIVFMETVGSPYRGKLPFHWVEWLVERTTTLLWGSVTGGCHFGYDTLSRLQTLKGTKLKNRKDFTVPNLGLRVVTGVVERIV